MGKGKIQRISEAVDNGGLSFPEVVKGLLAAGVEYYHVDYVARRKTFYDGAGSVIEKPLQLDGAPPVAADFQLEALRANIRDSQQRGQAFPDFSRRAMAAGAQGYFAFLRGQRVLYLGRQGDQHTEWFAGAEPSRAGRNVRAAAAPDGESVASTRRPYASPSRASRRTKPQQEAGFIYFEP